MDTQISGGFLATLIIIPIVLIILLILGIGGIIAGRSEREPEYTWFGIGVLALAFCTLIGTGLGMWPFKWEYHSWREINGIVNTVDSRIISTDAGPGTKYVVSFMGHEDDQYGVDDTRMAGIRTGSRLTITCKREFQFTGTDGWNCNFVRVEKAQ